MDEDFDQTFDDQMHCRNNKNPRMFLIKSDHDRYLRKNDDFVLEMNDDIILKIYDALSWETEEFKKGY
jgi:hypothetical protein